MVAGVKQKQKHLICKILIQTFRFVTAWFGSWFVNLLIALVATIQNSSNNNSKYIVRKVIAKSGRCIECRPILLWKSLDRL